MEVGFYHPDRGYWQAIDVKDEPITIVVEPERFGDEGEVIPAVTRQSTQHSELMASYPAGTVEVPLKPGERFVWSGVAWIELPPEPEPVPAEVNRRQILTALGMRGWISEAEAEAALTNGARPAAVDAIISQMPEDQRFAARMKWAGFQHAYPGDPMVGALAAIEGKSEEDIADLFRLAASIE